MSNPFEDALSFLSANTGDFLALGLWRFALLALFYALLAASLFVAVLNLADDPEQRRGSTLWWFFVRVMIGCMWFQGTLWKLPFGLHNGLYYWTEQMVGRASFAVQADFVKDVVLPHFLLFNPLVYFAELFFAVALMLGVVVRLSGTLAALFTVNLWLGIYNQRPGDPSEWPWSYVFLIFACGSLAVLPAGRALGVDAWLRREVYAVRERLGWGALIGPLT